MKRRAFAVSTLAASLAACAVGPDYHEPETSVPAAFGGLPGGEMLTAQPPVAAWWTTMSDPVLDSLVARAVRANPDLRRAQARVREARARSVVAGSGLYPQVDAKGGASRTRTSENLGGLPGGTANLFQAGFDAVWEVDLFGGVRREAEAADADVAASVEDRRDVLVSLLAEVARNYVEMRGAQRRVAIANANLAAQRETLELTRKRLAAGIASDLDVARSEAQTESTAATVPVLEAAARVSEHAIAVLLGEGPNALAKEMSGEAPVPAPPPQVPVGLPSDLLRRRPDVRRAERELAAATARIGAATADLYPRFTLTGALGLASDRLGHLVEARSRTASGGAGVDWPILEFGRLRGNVQAADAREEQALAAYEATVLASLGEVEDALTRFAKERSRRASLAAAAEAAKRAVDLASQLWKAGRTDFLSVLDAQRDLFAAQDALVQGDRAAAADLVALYKALGGGWEIEASAGEPPPRGEPGRREVDLSGAPVPSQQQQKR